MKELLIAAGIATLWGFCLPGPAQAMERMNASVHLNHEDKGTFLITLTDEGKILFTREDLLQLGFDKLPGNGAIGEDGYISLSPQVHAEFDETTGVLYLTANPELTGAVAPERTPTPVTASVTPSAPLPAAVDTPKQITTNVFLNGEDKGNYHITLTDTGKVLFTEEDLRRLSIKVQPGAVTGGMDGYISLSPRINAEFADKLSRLHLTVAPDLFEKKASDPDPEAGLLIANIHLNLEDKGDFFIKRTEKGEMLFTPEDILRLGFETFPSDINAEDGYLPLPPHVHSEFDNKTSILYLTVAPEQLGKTTIDLGRKHPNAGQIVHGERSGFINYGLSYSADNDLDFTSLSVPLEAGFTTNGYLGISSFSYFKDVDQERFVRLMSSIVKDIPEKQTRIIAGDFSTSSGILGSGGLFGGLSIAKKFALAPYSLRYPGANLYGAVDTPSDVEVYVNGLPVSREHLSPGEFEFQNIGNIQGSGEATLVITDAYGQKETITVPYYTSAQLLKPGLHDYSYSAGYQRESFGQESNEYGDAAFLGYHRVGLSNALTAGLRAEADNDVINGGFSTTFLLGTLGEFDISAAYSDEAGTTGDGWAVRYSRAGKYVSGGLFARGLSREYANLAVTAIDDKSRLESSGNIGFFQKQLGTISLFYSMRDMYEDVDRERYGVVYNRRLGKQMSLNIVAARTVTDTTSNEIFANLMILLGRSRSANVAHQKQDNETASRVSLQKNAPLGTGYGYRLSADHRDNGEDNPTSGGDAYFQYRGQHGIYSAEDRIINSENNYTVGTAGGIAFINSSAYFTRPIYDGFVLAKVGTFEKIAVNYNHQEMGVTDEHGELLIPGLISYHQNNISIDDKAIPVNYALSDISKTVTVPYRAGGVVRFDVKKLQGFTGKLLIRDRSSVVPAEYWGLQIKPGTEVQEVIVGKNGEFYLENLSAGHLPARVFRAGEECTFELSVPESDEIMVNMGEVFCERD